MKGLFIKDYSYIKQSKFLFLFLIIFGLGFSFIYDYHTFVYGYFSVFPSIMLMSTINYDDYNHGFTSLLSLPISKKEYIKQKYYLGLILGLLFLAIAFIISCLSYYRSLHSFQFLNSDLFCGCIMSLMFAYFIIALATPVAIYFGSQKGQLAMMVIFGGIFVMGFIIYFIFNILGIDLKAWIDTIASSSIPFMTLGIVVITAILNFISYQISIKIFNKKEY